MRESEGIQTNAMHRATSSKGRAVSGYTMVELVAVISIIAIMAAIAFGAIVQTQRDLQQRELDDTAREIFIAAQNHLSMADELGYTKRFSKKGTEDTYTSKETSSSDSQESVSPASLTPTANSSSNNTSTAYIYSVGESKTDLNDSSSLLSQMLPVGSIDDTVRNTGTYVIRYNPDTATVLDVFFAWRESTGIFSTNTNGFSFSSDDYSALFSDPDYRNDSTSSQDKVALRQNYNNNGVFIGYYGGAEADALTQSELNTPTVRLINGDRLYAEITYEISSADENKIKPEMDLIVTQTIDGNIKTKTISVFKEDNGPSFVRHDNNVDLWFKNRDNTKFYVLLDDITNPGSTNADPDEFNRHFAKVFALADGENLSTENPGLLPGADITVQVSVHTKQVLARTKKSNRATSNSLFASVNPEQGVVQISSIRHLENLSGGKSLSEGRNNISSFNPGRIKGWKTSSTNGSTNPIPVIAQQVSDLSWVEFCDTIGNQDFAADNAGQLPTQSVSDEAKRLILRDTVQITTASGDNSIIEQASFAPIYPKVDLTYNGGSHRISDVNIDLQEGDAGLFGALSYNSGSSGCVSDVALVDFNVKTESGSAGTLAGRVTDSVTRSNDQYTISNVAAYNSIDSTTKTDDSSLEVWGTQSIGGLVGEMSGGSIYRCAAAVYVKSTAATGSGVETSTAGGLVGSASGVDIMQSYAGGHTSSRTVDAGTDQAKLVVEYLSDAQSRDDKARGRLNVYATTGAAGGLVGTATRGSSDSSDGAQTSVRQSYSTASVHGGTYSGGIIGSMGANAASITSSYTVGLVHADEPTEGASTPAKGVFVGNDPTFTGGTNAGNSYSELGCGMAIDDFDSAETSTATYRNIAGAMTQARPYDPSLSEAYKGGYPYKTIEELANITGAMTGFIHAHYGDWPVIETMVVNQVN